ncbi:hypothetical protein [Nonomuraea africana]|uniref:Uncharacterized protein n=1 Tax=Nonomuraea africana TaxID=46171 RepID=A0ABR9KP30_9ACTN|nr:hypothetical protein [Nonomuraea africana]MBE1563776.1 hypothetical protein [Nonomuraea africana]
MRISPVIPTVASLLLAALWGLSVFAGWGLEAFCTDGETSVACAQRLDTVSTVSGLFAVLAACLTVGAWLLPLRFWALMGGAVAAWLVAAGVLFFGGLLAQ